MNTATTTTTTNTTNTTTHLVRVPLHDARYGSVITHVVQ